MRKILTRGALTLAFLAGPALAAGGGGFKLLDTHFKFEGPLGTYDYAAVQRGFQVYKEKCAACHSMSLLSYRNLRDIGLSEAAVKAIAADVMVDDIDDKGAKVERPGRPSDRFRSPFANEAAARAANNGASPPDLSLIVKARVDGARYVYSLMQGYDDMAKASAADRAIMDGYAKKATGDAKATFAMATGRNFNTHFPGMQIAMPQPLRDGDVTYVDGTKNDLPQLSKDLVSFLAWASEPKMEERKNTGVKVIIFMLILAGLMYAVKRKVWAGVH